MFTKEQAAEVAKYQQAYSADNYRMGDRRRIAAEAQLALLPWRRSYLDVACGRGEMLDYARSIGFREVRGTEVVPKLLRHDEIVMAAAWSLPFPDKSFEVVTLFDAIEHLLAGDDEATCRELARVASRVILLTANNAPSRNHIGQELHVNRRPYEEWDRLFQRWFPGTVSWLPRGDNVSETWQVIL